MSNHWRPYNADEDLKRFISEAEDSWFYKRFAAWKGKREDFKYEIYKNTLTERKYQALLRGDTEPIMTARDMRRAFKAGMAKLEARLERERQERESRRQQRQTSTSSQQEEARQEDCLRCILIKRGTIMIGEMITHTCQVSFVPSTTEVTEESADIRVNGKTENEDEQYLQTLSVSNAFMNCKDTPSIQENISPITLVKNQMISDNRIFKRVTRHICPERTNQIPTRSVELQLSSKLIGERESGNCLIYAPPGFGKTTFQHTLVRRGVLMGDTDDMPEANIDKVKEKLKLTSVLTNRMDIANAYKGMKILFVPNAPETLKQRSGFDLSDSQYQYWYHEHEKMHVGAHSIKCKLKTTFINDWFVGQYTNPKQTYKIDTDCEERLDFLTIEHRINHQRWMIEENQKPP